MISFTLQETINSILSALIYGLIFSIVLVLLGCSVRMIGTVLTSLRQAFFYTGRISTPLALPQEANRSSSLLRAVYAALRTVAFFLGFLLLSYYALDGCIRIYMLLISLFSCLLFRTMAERLAHFIGKLLLRLLFCAVVVIRFASFPVRFALLCTAKRIRSKCAGKT